MNFRGSMAKNTLKLSTTARFIHTNYYLCTITLFEYIFSSCSAPRPKSRLTRDGLAGGGTHRFCVPHRFSVSLLKEGCSVGAADYPVVTVYPCYQPSTPPVRRATPASAFCLRCRWSKARPHPRIPLASDRPPLTLLPATSTVVVGIPS